MYDKLAKEDIKKASDPKSTVQVYYNSTRPAQIHANAYTRGNEIYLGKNHEDSLPHELGHVLQQRQKSVPTDETMNGVGINLDQSLEQEADRLGSDIGNQAGLDMKFSSDSNSAASASASPSAPV
ncbi:MAG: DUF4157 domain-containing protein, partial [Oscillospiraceae bacterium]